MSNQVIRVGLAGFGMSGQLFQAPFIHADPRFRLHKIYARSGNLSETMYPDAHLVRDFDELLTEDIDLIVISTPNTLHVPMARQALEQGKSVIVEKPIAATSAEAASLVALAQSKQLLFSVYQNRRLDGGFLTLKHLIDEGALGQLIDVEIRFDRFVRGRSSKAWKNQGGPGVDLLYDLGVHMMDQAYVLFGMPDGVYADFRKHRLESPGFDHFEVMLSYGTLKVTVSANESVVHPGPHIKASGRRGCYVKYGMDVQEKALLAGKQPSDPEWGQETPDQYGILYTEKDGHFSSEPVETVRGHYGLYYDNFYKAYTQQEALLVPPEEAVQVLMLLEAAQQSHQERRWVALT